MSKPWQHEDVLGELHLRAQGGDHEVAAAVNVHAHFDDDD
jgi:hypothetical protein